MSQIIIYWIGFALVIIIGSLLSYSRLMSKSVHIDDIPRNTAMYGAVVLTVALGAWATIVTGVFVVLTWSVIRAVQKSLVSRRKVLEDRHNKEE